MTEATTPQGNADDNTVSARLASMLAPPQEDTTEDETQPELDQSDENEYPEEEELSESELPRYRVKDPDTGQEMMMTGDELASSWMRQSDYTRKTQHLAEDRKVVEHDRKQVVEERHRYTDGLKQYLNADEPQPPAESVFEDDPLGYMKAKDDYRDALAQRHQAEAELQRISEQERAEQHHQMQAHLSQESQRLAEIIPEWTDPDTAKREKDAIKEFGQSIGYTPDELDAVTDSRAVLVLRDAMLHATQTNRGRTKLRPVEGVPAVPSGRPTRQRMSEYTKAQLQLRKSGRPDDATRAIAALIKSTA